MVKVDYQDEQSVDKENVPAYLIRDMIDGQPFYYKGYKEILNKTKTLQYIMPCSTLQAAIIMYLNRILIQKLGISKHRIFTSSGNQLAKNINYGLDLAVYDKRY